MKTILIILFLFASFTQEAHAQFVEAEQCLGDDQPNIVIHVFNCNDSGIIIVETQFPANEFYISPDAFQDIRLIKLNKNNEIEWYKKYGDIHFTKYLGLEDDQAGYYLYTDKYTDFLGTDTDKVELEIRRLDLNGNVQWLNKRLVRNEQFEDLGLGDYFNFTTRRIKNNTILLNSFSGRDSSFNLININADGTQRWSLKIKYDSIYKSKPLDGERPVIQYFDLGDSTVLVTTSLTTTHCISGTCYDHYYNEYRLISYNGIILKHSSDTFMPVFDGGTTKFITSTASQYVLAKFYQLQTVRINKATLQVAQVDTLKYWLIENSGYNVYNIKRDTAKSQIYLSSLSMIL